MNLLRQRCAVFGIAFFILFALFSPRVQANAYEAEYARTFATGFSDATAVAKAMAQAQMPGQDFGRRGSM